MKIEAAYDYDETTRKTANDIKDAGNKLALMEAAETMGLLVPSRAVLVPVPSSSGLNHATRVLAGYIAKWVPGAEVVDMLRRRWPVPSSTILRRQGLPAVSEKEHVESMESKHPLALPSDRPIVLVDNVVTEGNTLRAAARVLAAVGRAPDLAVVYADARRYWRPGLKVRANAGARVCISGSRTFGALDKVDTLVNSLPAWSLVVHGGVRGVDERADWAARVRGLEVEEFPSSAGPIRNCQMVASCDFLYAFWDGVSRGTASAIKAAQKAEVDYEVIYDD
jgi:hypothetical protein